MQTRVSTKGQIVLPLAIRRRLGIRPGDRLEVSVEQGRVVLDSVAPPQAEPEIIKDPISGLPVISFGPDVPILTSEQVAELLVDFP